MLNKILTRFCSFCLILTTLLCILCVNADVKADGTITINIPESTELITRNPGKGWVRYGTSNTNSNPELSKKAIEYSSVAYFRWNWYQIEPSEGEFNWKPIDDAIAYWDQYGIKFAFGIMNANTSDKTKFITPEWVFNAGAKYTDINTNPFSGDPFIQAVPDWNDAIYKSKLRNFVNALAQRYDNDPRVAWIDIRSFGNYGEWHLYRLEGSEMPSTECQTELAQIYVDAFKKKNLMIPREALLDSNIGSKYILDNNIYVRNDGAYILLESGARNIADDVSTCSEIIQPYQTFVQLYGFDKSKYIDFFTKFKQSYMDLGEWGDNTEAFINDNEDLIRKLTNKMGYHFVLKNVTLPKTVESNSDFTVNFGWINKGITFLHEKCKIAVAVLDNNENVVKKYWSNTVPTNNWAPGKTVNDSVQIGLDGLVDSTYTIAVGLYTDADNENPDYKIGNYGRTQSGWYPVATAVKKEGSCVFNGCIKQVNLNGKNIGVKTAYYNNAEYLSLSIFQDITVDENKNVCWNLDGVDFRVDKNDDMYINGVKSNLDKPVIRKNGSVYCSKQFINSLDVLVYEEVGDVVYITDPKRKYNDFDRVNKIVDAGFELFSNAWSYDDSLCSVTDADSTEGKYSLKLDASNDSAAVYQTISLDANMIYKLGFDVKSDSSLVCSIVKPGGNVAFKAYIPSTDEQWERYELQLDSVDVAKIFFDDLSVESVATIKIEADGSGKNSYLDNFSLSKISTLNQLANDGVIIDYGAEIDVHPWKVRGQANLERTYGVANSGSYSFNVKYAGQWGGAQADVTDIVAGQEGGKYHMEFYARTDSEDLKPILVLPCKIEMASGASKEIMSKYLNVTTEWKKFEIDFEIGQDDLVAAEDITQAIAIIGNGSLDNIGKSVYFDDVRLIKVD